MSAKRTAYAGVFLLSLCTLVHELLITRIFSVTMWYHFAFMAISIAMHGMTTGAVIVHRLSRRIEQDPRRYFGSSMIWCSITIATSFFMHLVIPFQAPRDLVSVLSLGITFTIMSLPFVASGVGITIALTKLGQHVSRVYAADLVGAALACILFFGLLSFVDGPSAVLINAGLVGLMGVALSRRWYRFIPVAILLVGSLNAVVDIQGRSPIHLVWIKGGLDPKPLYETWNSYSRIAVYDDPLIAARPFGWGLSRRTPLPDSIPKQLLLNIDAGAGTVLTHFSGDLKPVSYLKYDLTNLAHHLRPNSRVLALGAGGGRDLLSALVFDQPSVTGVEINKAITGVLSDRFRDFTGSIARNPRVRLVNQEARNFVVQSDSSFDIIQVSLIDTWAATAAGAFALSENSLYTKEAWVSFLEHLSPRGVLTFSRWWVKDNPAEIYRLVSLASSALRAAGVSDPRQNILLVRNDFASSGGPDGVGTILVSKTPFTDIDIRSTQAICDSLDFIFSLSPKHAKDNNLAILTLPEGPAYLSKSTGLRLAAPTDDDPFFFHVVKFSSVITGLLDQGGVSFNMKAVLILLISFVLVLVLSVAFIILPLRITEFRKLGDTGMLYLGYFGLIGLAFMLVEVSQIQSLNIYLGHPVLSLTVALFSILIASGVGSFTVGRGKLSIVSRSTMIPIVILLVGLLTPLLLHATEAGGLATRILVSVALLFPIGFFMGMAFPIGMERILSSDLRDYSAWFWGINGATSVCGSVLAMILSLSFGISTAFYCGMALYVIVAALLYFATHRQAVS